MAGRLSGFGGDGTQPTRWLQDLGKVDSGFEHVP